MPIGYSSPNVETHSMTRAMHKTCGEGAERAAKIDTGDVPKNARTLPVFGKGVRS
jgi:hypothetical protein